MNSQYQKFLPMQQQLPKNLLYLISDHKLAVRQAKFRVRMALIFWFLIYQVFGEML